MNRRYTFLPAVLPLWLAAQPTLQQAMVDPGGLSIDVYTVVSPGSAQPPSPGANQTWDLSSMVLSNVGTLDFVPAAGTPFASSYPAANWAWVTTPTGQVPDLMYLAINNGGIEVVATEVPSSPNVYTDTKKVLAFPMTYGQTISDNYIDNDGPATVAWTYAGHGTTILPYATFPNSVLLISTEDDVLIWNTNPLHPIALDDGNSVTFFGPGSVGVDEAGGQQSLNAFPNPCNEVLQVDLPNDATWRITDMQGRLLLTGRITTAARQELPVAALAPGAYVLLVDQAGATRSLCFVKD